MQWNCRNIVTFLHKIQKLKPFIRKIRQTQIDEHSSKLSRSLKTRKHQEMIIVWRLKDMRPPRWCCGKEPSCQCRRHKRCGLQSLGQEDPLEEGRAPVFLPGESPWTDKPGGLQSMGSQRVQHDWRMIFCHAYVQTTICTKWCIIEDAFQESDQNRFSVTRPTKIRRK